MLNKNLKSLICAFAIFYLLTSRFSFAGTVDKVIVIINQETITQSEFDTAISAMTEKLKEKYQGEELAAEIDLGKRDILDRMIEDKLVLSEAKKQGIQVTPAEIETKLQEIRSRFPSEEKFDAVLKESDVSLAELKEKYSEQLMVSKLIDAEVRRRVIITPAEISEYYKAHSGEFSEPEQVRLKNILIKPEDGLDDKAAAELAEKILGFLEAGGNFDELALKYSKGPNADRGGDLGFVRRGQMLKDIEEVVFNLNAGRMSGVIKTQVGYHIFKVEEKKAEGIKKENEVKEEIEKILYVEKAKTRYQEWVEELKKNAYISHR